MIFHLAHLFPLGARLQTRAAYVLAGNRDEAEFMIVNTIYADSIYQQR